MLEALLGAALRSLVLTGLIGLGLRAARLRGPQIQLTAWTIVLAASLLMPGASRLTALALPPAPFSAPSLDFVFSPPVEAGLKPRSDTAVSGVVDASATTAQDPGPEEPAPRVSTIWPDWRALILLVYATVAGALLARLAAGLLVTGRMVRSARRLCEPWTAGRDVRVSPEVASPATFGATILLPLAFADWPLVKRAAVLAHETAHVRRGDFYVQIAANVNRALFWFSPASWWLRRRLSELAEAASDDDAIGHLRDRPLYAQILLEVSCGSPIPPGGVAMARPATLRARIERILADSTAPTPVGKRVRSWLVVGILFVAVIMAVPLTARSSNAVQDEVVSAERQQAPHLRVAIDPKLLDADVGFYEDMATGAVMTVTREDDHLVTRRTGRSPVAEYPYSPRDFFMTVAAEQDAFVADATGKTLRVLHRRNGLTTAFERISPDAAARLDADFERRVAEELTPRVAIKVNAATLDGYVGTYQLNSTYIFTVTRDGDHLFAQGTGQKKFAVYPYSEHDFFYTVVAAQLTFIDSANGTAGALILHQDGKDRTAKRVSAEIAQAFQQRLDDELKPRIAVSIDTRVLDRYVGRYTGPALSMTITRDGDRLYAQVLGFNKYQVYPYTERDFFATTLPAQISFVADSHARVVQLVRHEHGEDLVLNRL